MNDSVTVTFVPEQLIAWVIIGLIAGLFAGLLVRGRGLGVVSNVVVGLLGALLGGFLFTVLHLQVPFGINGGIMLYVRSICWRSDYPLAFRRVLPPPPPRIGINESSPSP
jgi:uncharacterized membrane protein YeaQ/YmgE (transglycosylase-associated protein family)